MKLIKFPALLALAIPFAFTACKKKSTDSNSGKPTVLDEKTAIANFKGEIQSAGKWIEEKQKSAGRNPTDGAKLVGDIVARLQRIPTDGLPAELKAAWGEMGGVLSEMSETFKTMPKPDASKPADTGRMMREFMPKMIAIQGKVQPVAKKLEDIGRKYGLDMTKVNPGNR